MFAPLILASAGSLQFYLEHVTFFRERLCRSRLSSPFQLGQDGRKLGIAIGRGLGKWLIETRKVRIAEAGVPRWTSFPQSVWNSLDRPGEIMPLRIA